MTIEATLENAACNQYLTTRTVSVGPNPMKLTGERFYQTRKLVIVKNNGGVDVAIGSKEHGLNADTGYRLKPGDEIRLPIGPELDVFGIALSQMMGSAVSVMELG